MSKGILYIAKDNDRISHIRLAALSAKLAKRHLEVPTCLAVEENQFKKMPKKVQSKFDEVIYVDFPKRVSTKRFIFGGEKMDLPYFNTLRPRSYNLSPFDETLIVDTDFLIQTDSLSNVWGAKYPLLMNTESRTIQGSHQDIVDRRLGNLGPKIVWATVTYFRKSGAAKEFFDRVKDVQENYEFYRRSFTLPSHLFRNDYAFAIAAHLMGESENLFKDLPIPMIHAYPETTILGIQKDALILEADIPVRVNMDVHFMNKLDLISNLRAFEKVYGV